MKSGYQGKICLSGTLYNCLSKMEENLYEFDFILNDKTICSYDDERNKSFDVNVWDSVEEELKKYNIRMITEHFINNDEAVDWLRNALKRQDVFLFVKARMLDYDVAFKYSREAMHVICVQKYDKDMEKYYVADSFISNAPLVSFYGWVDRETVENAWIGLKRGNFYLEFASRDFSFFSQNRINNLRAFLENYSFSDYDDERAYGVAAVKKLVNNTIRMVEKGDNQELEDCIVSLNYFFRADSIIGLMQLIRDSFQWLGDQKKYNLWNKYVMEMDEIIEALIKELLICTKMSLRKNREKVLESLKSMIIFLDKEANICKSALGSINDMYY